LGRKLKTQLTHNDLIQTKKIRKKIKNTVNS